MSRFIAVENIDRVVVEFDVNFIPFIAQPADYIYGINAWINLEQS